LSRHSLKRRRKGFACHHLNPIRYIVRGASHPVISATVARPRRDRQEHAGYSPDEVTICKYIQLCDIVSQRTLRITGWQWSVAELPVRVNAVVNPAFLFSFHMSVDTQTFLPVSPPLLKEIIPVLVIPEYLAFHTPQIM